MDDQTCLKLYSSWILKIPVSWTNIDAPTAVGRQGNKLPEREALVERMATTAQSNNESLKLCDPTACYNQEMIAE